MKPLSNASCTALKDSRLMTAALRLLGSLALYWLFGLLAETVYAATPAADPFDATQGSVWLQQDDGSYVSALLLETDVDIDVSGMIARAQVRQRFSNTGDVWAEGIYVFPLPENAAVDHFRLTIGARVIEGRIRERSEARAAYETAKSEGRRAGLMEQHRPNVFTTSLANIAPGEAITVEIEYQQMLDFADGGYRLRFPLVAGPRYRAASDGSTDQSGAGDFETVIAESAVNPVYIQVSLDAGLPVEDLHSSYHAIDIRQTDVHRYSIALAGEAVTDRDFELTWRPAPGHEPRAVAFRQSHDGHEYLLLSVLPPELDALGQQQLPRDVVFILDVSGSMSGTSIEQARSSLLHALSRLGPRDRFNIIWFNDRSERLYAQSVPASADNIQYAGRIINTLEAGGGTVMQPALALALSKQPEPSRIRQIIFLTDGNVDNEQALFALIKQQLGENRLFTVGIGSAPNSYFMRKAARSGRGTFTHIGDIGEVERKTSALFEKLEAPALINIDVRLQGRDIEVFPEPPPDLYLGEPLTLVVRGTDLGGTVELYGDYGESTWQQTLVLNRSFDHPGIRNAWARSKIASLMEQHHDAASNPERDRLKQAIIQTSIDHHLLSRYTALVAVDITPVNSSGLLHSERLKTNLPHGWERGRPGQPGPQQMLMAHLSLPQTATSAATHFMIALMLCSLAMVFYLWRRLL